MADEEKDLISDEVSEEIIQIAEQMAKTNGAHTVTVRSILKKLGATNRVFYNRFRNIDKVLGIVYKRAVFKMRESLRSEYDITKDFSEYVMDVAVKVLINTYEIKMQFGRYMFEHDSLSRTNYEWWTLEIKKLIEYGKSISTIRKDIDSDMLSYTVWCFCRGFNADAFGRKLPLEEAVNSFKFGFRLLLDSVKA